MIEIVKLLKKIQTDIVSQSENVIDLIIKQNARVENYFSVIIISTLSKLKEKGEIIDYEFQHFISGRKRQHIDFYITTDEFEAYIEVKHLAIDTEKKRNKRTFNFYTSTAPEGKKVGIVNDMEKLDQTNSQKGKYLISFSIVTNPPNQEIVQKRLKYMTENPLTSNWDYEYCDPNSKNIAFIIWQRIIV